MVGRRRGVHGGSGVEIDGAQTDSGRRSTRVDPRVGECDSGVSFGTTEG